MIRYRPFLNTDPPLIVDIWRHQPTFRGQLSAVSRAILDQHIFGKTYFDRSGLIVAVDESADVPRALGFVHAGFAPNDQLSDLNHSVGIISQLKIVPGDHASEVGSELVNQATQYLVSKGATIAHAGSKFPFAPFYVGLYGGSRVPGILAADELTVQTLKDAGFSIDDEVVVMERVLAGFRTVIDREQMALRRRYQIKAVADPLETSWWESCTLGWAERDRFSVTDKRSDDLSGSVSFWDIQPLATEWGTSCRGMYDLSVNAELRRKGMATFLVSEALRHLMLQGIGRVEVQTSQSDAPALGVFNKMGFETVATGHLMSKSL